jgi:hypothetical protein
MHSSSAMTKAAAPAVTAATTVDSAASNAPPSLAGTGDATYSIPCLSEARSWNAPEASNLLCEPTHPQIACGAGARTRILK